MAGIHRSDIEAAVRDLEALITAFARPTTVASAIVDAAPIKLLLPTFAKPQSVVLGDRNVLSPTSAS